MANLHELDTALACSCVNASPKMVLQFELPDLPSLDAERDGKRMKLPRVVSIRLTRSLNQKVRLRALLETWHGLALHTDRNWKPWTLESC